MNNFWDFEIKIKNFSAIDVIDSRDLRIYEKITYRNGINKTELSKSSFKNLMIYNLEYLDLLSKDDEVSDIVGWLKFFVKNRYAISFIETEKKILTARIRLFDRNTAFKFKIQYYDYIQGN